MVGEELLSCSLLDERVSFEFLNSTAGMLMSLETFEINASGISDRIASNNLVAWLGSSKVPTKHRVMPLPDLILVEREYHRT